MSDNLREGFTTGTAAAAAAYAAAGLLLHGLLPSEAEVALPPFERRGGAWFSAGERPLRIPIENGGLLGGPIAWASVVKDGGDDPDATHGARLVAYVSQSPFTAAVVAGISPPGLLSQAPEPLLPVSVAGFSAAVYLYGGPGVGKVTLPGLPVPVGEPAINPEPRKQIAAAVCCAAREYSSTLHILLCVPDGRERAARTLNPRLGILGGISILGTRGTVRPYSHEAWTGTIEQALNVAQALNIGELILSTGRRSERLAFALHPAFPPQAGIQVADYAAFALREAEKRSFSRLHWACFPGKLLKLAQGLEWTHAKAGATDIAWLAELCREEGASVALARQVEKMPTAAGAFEILAEASASLHDRVLRRLADTAMGVMRGWLDAEASGEKSSLSLVLYVFSMKQELALRIEG